MDIPLFIIFMIIIFIFLVLVKEKNRKEGYFDEAPPGYRWPCTNYNNWSNDLKPYAANCAATPWSVAVPSWIGQLDQGNGRIGDDSLSGYAYYKAY